MKCKKKESGMLRAGRILACEPDGSSGMVIPGEPPFF